MMVGDRFQVGKGLAICRFRAEQQGHVDLADPHTLGPQVVVPQLVRNIPDGGIAELEELVRAVHSWTPINEVTALVFPHLQACDDCGLSVRRLIVCLVEARLDDLVVDLGMIPVSALLRPTYIELSGGPDSN